MVKKNVKKRRNNMNELTSLHSKNSEGSKTIADDSVISI